MKQEHTAQPVIKSKLADSISGFKGDLWKQEDIKKRHQKFIQEENIKRSRYNIETNWNTNLNDEIPQVRSPIASLNLAALKSNHITSTSYLPQVSIDRKSESRSKNKSVYYYTDRNNIGYEEPSFLRRRNKQDREMKELIEALAQKDATIRKLKKQNYNLKSQLKNQLNHMETESKLRQSQQQNLINALHEQLKQLMEPKGITVEGRSFYAEELERQMTTLEDRLHKAHETNQELENIITTLYSENNGGSFHLNNSFSSSRHSARSKILECLAILSDNS